MDPGILVRDFSGPFFKVRIVPFLIVRFLLPHFSFLIVSGVSHILQFSFLRFQTVLLLRSSRSPCSLLITKIRMNCQEIVFFSSMYRIFVHHLPRQLHSPLLLPFISIVKIYFTFHYERILIGDYYKKYSIRNRPYPLRWSAISRFSRASVKSGLITIALS